jgi:hypothetical protein
MLWIVIGKMKRTKLKKETIWANGIMRLSKIILIKLKGSSLNFQYFSLFNRKMFLIGLGELKRA